MIVIHDPACAEYGSAMRPEQPARVTKSAAHLRSAHPDWEWRMPVRVEEATVRLAHDASLLARLHKPVDIDDDTPYFDGISDYAMASVGGAIAALDLALEGKRAFSLMRPPGHHATGTRAMGFCYLNSIAIAALEARRRGLARVAVWDFDAHHGNGTEEILEGRGGCLYVSVHQHPCYPGTGITSQGNCRNFPVAPRTPRAEHLAALRQSWDEIVAWHPDVVLVSAGFDAYARDPITAMTLEADDFAALGSWLRDGGIRAAAVLEGGYSPDLPQLIDAFLSSWDAPLAPAR